MTIFKIDTYTPLFDSVFDSSLWSLPGDTIKIFLWLIHKADKETGIARSTVPGVARANAVSVEAAEKAIEELKAPDPHSRSKAHEGRRLMEVEDGWLLVNFLDHQEKIKRRSNGSPNSSTSKNPSDSSTKENENENDRTPGGSTPIETAQNRSCSGFYAGFCAD